MKVPQPVYGTRSNGLIRSLNGVIRDGTSPNIHTEQPDYVKKEGGSPRTVLVQSSTHTPTHQHNITNNNKPTPSQITIINNSVVNATTSNQTETSSTSSSVQNNPSINTAAATAQGTIILDNRSNLIIKKIPSSDDTNKNNNSASDDNCSESEQPTSSSSTTTITTTPPSSSSTVSSSSLSVNDSGYRGSNNTVIISNRLNQHTHHLNSIPSQYHLISESPGGLLPASQLHIANPQMPPYNSWAFDLSTKTDITEKGEILPGMVVGGSTALFETMRNNNIALYNVGEGTLLNHAPTNVNDIIHDTLKEYNQEEQHGQHEEANYLTLNSANGETESRSPMHQEDISFVQLQNVTQMNHQILEAEYEHENR